MANIGLFSQVGDGFGSLILHGVVPKKKKNSDEDFDFLSEGEYWIIRFRERGRKM